MRKQKPSREKLIIGITGGFGSGKTTVAHFFASRDAELISADSIAHDTIKPGTRAYKRIIKVFGNRIIGKDKRIDRAGLAQRVFRNSTLLKKLERITHPQIIRVIKDRIKGSRSRRVILDAPLLIEAGLKDLVDALIVVKAEKTQQIKRIHKLKSSLSKADIERRIRSQIPLKDKVALADFVIDNSGTIKNTKIQVERIRRLLWKS